MPASVSPFAIEWCKRCNHRYNCPLGDVTYKNFEAEFPPTIMEPEKYRFNFMNVIRKEFDLDKAWRILIRSGDMPCVKSWVPNSTIDFRLDEFEQFALNKKLWKEQYVTGLDKPV